MLEIPEIHFPYSCIQDKWQPNVVWEEHALSHHYRRTGVMNRFYSPTKYTVRDYAFQHDKDYIIRRIEQYTQSWMNITTTEPRTAMPKKFSRRTRRKILL